MFEMKCTQPAIRGGGIDVTSLNFNSSLHTEIRDRLSIEPSPQTRGFFEMPISRVLFYLPPPTRNPVLQQRRTAVYGKRTTDNDAPPDAASQSSTSRTRKRRRRDVPRSLLEEMPAEVVQLIFEYSTNVDLPLTSTLMARKLRKSAYLQRQLTDRLLDPVLGFEDATQTAPHAVLTDATRLLNSRFMTFGFFQAWLQSRSAFTSVASGGDQSSAEPTWSTKWSALCPSPGLLPPDKLLRSPFSADKVGFLKVFADQMNNIVERDPAYGEIAYEGLMHAIQEQQLDVVTILLSLGLRPSTELLRVAVTEAGCDEDLVRLLAGHVEPEDSVDLLDPVLWAWAEKARANGNAKGDWLIAFLRELQR
ncbi:unnamed protein product [Zymoseptoria tritici ST99CH_1E4]|uniref:Uncharacterized protein n=1 Tax=Zymoseptoria tritici ST99CH_1E4 TaxID=1276532 RepID=A0A2H1FM47_ZYMTR|nr:unnamed protein product [Zymoseptoria tritici ST99CH_1E4]